MAADEGDRPGPPAAVAGELLELLARHGDVDRLAVAAGVDDGEELGGHDGEVVVLLVAVGAGAEVDLGDRVEAVAGVGVDERGDLDAVAGRDGQALDE